MPNIGKKLNGSSAGCDGKAALSFETVAVAGCSAMLVRPETLVAA